MRPTFDGDSGVNPGGLIGFSAIPEFDNVGNGLTLKEEETSHLFEDSCAHIALKVSCVNFGTGWLGDYFRLAQCHSLISACAPSTPMIR